MLRRPPPIPAVIGELERHALEISVLLGHPGIDPFDEARLQELLRRATNARMLGAHAMSETLRDIEMTVAAVRAGLR